MQISIHGKDIVDTRISFLNEVISFLILAFLTQGKYLAKHFSAKPFHVAMEFGYKEFNQLLALSLREYGKNLNLKASSIMPGILKLLPTFRNCLKCNCESSFATHEY